MPDSGTGEREADAIRVLGERCAQLKVRVVATFVIAGLVVGVVAGLVTQVAQPSDYDHYKDPSIVVDLAAGIASWLVIALIGWRLAGRTVAHRLPALVDELATRYQIPKARLDEAATLLRG